MLTFNKKSIESSRHIAQSWLELNKLRDQHDRIQANALKGMGQKLNNNAAALLPKEAYQEMDSITQRVFTNDEGQEYMASMMGIAKGMNIGKTTSIYRLASDKADNVIRSMSGQVPSTISKTNYTYNRDPIPLFTTGYGREWREQASFSTEGFDAMFDDHENAMREIKEDMARYMLTGDSGIVVDGATGRGILNHANTQKLDLGAAGANISLISATADEIVAYFTGPFAKELDNNFVTKIDEMWISPQMMRNFQKPYSNAAGFKEGTVLDYLLQYGRIESIKSTFELGRSISAGQGDPNADGEGNEFFCYVRDQQVLCPLVAQSASVIAIPRMMPMDNVNNLVWGAMGFRVKADANGRSKVFYASEIS